MQEPGLFYADSSASVLASCSNLKCQKFVLPVTFSNATVNIDLGRNVQLLKLDVVLNSVVLPPNVTFNLALNISSGNTTLLCVRSNIQGFTITFDCQNKGGRYLILKLAVIDATSSSSSNSPSGEAKEKL